MAAAKINQFTHFLAECFFSLSQFIAKSHHVAVVRVIAAHFGILIALVDARNTGNSHIENF